MGPNQRLFSDSLRVGGNKKQIKHHPISEINEGNTNVLEYLFTRNRIIQAAKQVKVSHIRASMLPTSKKSSNISRETHYLISQAL